MSLFGTRLIVVDTETTGFPNQEWARIVEIGAVCLDEDGEEIGVFSSLLRPDIFDERADGALAVNKIPRADIEAAPRTERVMDGFAAWIVETGACWISAYNVAFDRFMLEAVGLARRLPGLRWASCIMLRSQAALRLSRWPSLTAAARNFGVVPDGDAHRALTDARTAAKIAIEIKRRAAR